MTIASEAILDRTSFITAHTRLLPVAHTPEIQLYLADEATALWSKTEEELGEMGLPPPFWACLLYTSSFSPARPIMARCPA